jgi:hypothetical protein
MFKLGWLIREGFFELDLRSGKRRRGAELPYRSGKIR